MNTIQLIGNLTDDPKKYDSEDFSLAYFKLAVTRDFKNEQSGEYDTDFIPVKCFGKTAENTLKYAYKGGKLGLVGRLEIRNYKKDDEYKTQATVVAEKVWFLSKKETPEEAPQRTSTGVRSGFDPDIDLPF